MSGRAPPQSFIASRPGVVVALSVGAAAALLAGAMLWRGDSPVADRPKRILDAVDVVTPAPLSDEETKRTGGALDQERVALEAGAWVQVADEHGRLQQSYRAARIDPEPDRWVRMQEPVAIMYSGEDRVMTMRADRGRARIPKRALQAGRLEGQVLIRVFTAPEGGKVLFENGEPIGDPSIVILAEEAQFDEVLGEIRCDRWVELTAIQESTTGGAREVTTIAFKGEGLSISVDSQQRTIERLVVERALGPIVITREGGELLPGTVAVRETRAAGAEGGAAPTGSAPVLVEATPPGEVVAGGAETAAAGAGAASPGAGTATATPAAVDSPTAPIASAAAAAPPAPNPTTSARAAAPSPGDPPAPPRSLTEFRPYALTLHENVVVRRINAGRESVVRGDRLVALFAMEGQGLRNALATGAAGTGRTPASDSGSSLAASLEWWALPPTARLVLMAIAAPQGAAPLTVPPARPGVDLITIDYDGRLVMVPAVDQRHRLENADDVLLSIEAEQVGSRRYVEVEDVRTLSRARCDRLVYQRAKETIDLEGTVEQRLELTSPQIELEGGAFHFHRPSGKGTVGGAGTMSLGQSDARPSSPAPGGGGGQGAIDPRPKEAPRPRDLEIVWTKGLDIQLADEKRGGNIKSAHFQGGVKVDGADFALATDGLRVYFAEEGENVIKQIRAEGGAVASRLGEAGELAAQVISVDIAEGREGRQVPSAIEARGGVTAKDANQTMWSDDLRVTFREKPESADAAAPRDDGPLGGRDLGQVEVATVSAGTLTELAPLAPGGEPAAEAAPRGVQMLLKDGARVFARRLDGDATKRQVKLLGPDVMIVQKNLVADRLDHLFIDETARTITADGPGRFRYYRDPVTDAAPSPRERPDPTGAISLDATWSERMHYDDRGNNGGGSIDLNGGVKVRASRSDREFSKLDAKTVQLDLRREPESTRAAARTADTAPAAVPGSERGDPALGTGVRRIQRLIAKEDAVLESQTWQNDERTGARRLFQISGDHVEYDTMSGEALVAGPGKLVVHDASGSAAAGGLDARGSSRFKWSTSMDMKQLGSQRYLVTMKDGVEVLHAGTRQGDDLTLTCDQLETTLLRPGVGVDGGGAGAGARPKDAADAASVDLGGAAELLRVRGIGRVMVRAPDADIECEEFDYDVRTQIAQMKGREGRLVKVLRPGAPAPITAASVLWDRQTGRITVQSGSGAVGR